jgi:glycerol-1-phosphate dehydrogenase [NAD(P)+]
MSTLDIDPALLARAMDPDLRIGRGLLEGELASLPEGFALVGQADPLALVPGDLRLRAAGEWHVESLEEGQLEAMVASLPPGETIVGIGGGMAMDAAKYAAWRTHRGLVLVPSVLSVDACVANSIAVRVEGTVTYKGFVVADRILVDLDLVRQAPARLNRAGVGDLLSIHTALHDWRLAARAGRVTHDEDIAARAAAILAGVAEAAPGIGAVTDEALDLVARSYNQVNALLLRAGHSHPEEGSEHYLAYHIERETGRSFVHGELVGLGVVAMAVVQGNRAEHAVRILDDARVAWRPEQLDLDDRTLAHSLGDLPVFVRDAGLPYSIIDEADLSADRAGQIVRQVLELASGGTRP